MLKFKRLLMVGQFPPPITGEAVVNNAVEHIFKSKGVRVDKINSCILKNVNNVGEINFIKIVLAIIVIVKSMFFTLKNQSIYVTPGQTSFGAYRFIPIIAFALLLNKKVVVHWHGYGVYRLVKKNNFLKKIYFSSKIKTILLTNDLKNKLSTLKIDISNLVVIPNFVETTNHRVVNDTKSDNLTVLFLGGLMHEKGITNFIEAAKALPGYDFIVCGSGSNDIEAILKKEDDEGHLKFKGTVTGKIKESILRTTDIFVLQSSYPTEGAPLAILEAMSYGCAILTTNHNGIPETIGEAGLFVKKDCHRDLVAKIAMLKHSKTKLNSLKQKSLLQVQSFTIDEFEKNIIKTLL